MNLVEDVIGMLADHQGLVRVPLFGFGRGPDVGNHEVLLDGPYGSLAISDAQHGVDPRDAGSWAWSSNVPHHAVIVRDIVSVRRWDDPTKTVDFSLAQALGSSDELERFLNKDRVGSTDTIVARNMDLFRTIRVMVAQRGGGDGDAVDAYLGLLGWLSSTDEPGDSTGSSLASEPWMFALQERPLREALQLFLTNEVRGLRYRALASLSVRHASGPIFQEAHRSLDGLPSANLFGWADPVAARSGSGSDAHFTPPTLARSLSEQMIGALGDLSGRTTLVVADFTCGSGAFLVECMRALERTGFSGSLRVVGRDSSPLATRMAAYMLGTCAAEWRNGVTPLIDVSVGDALLDDLPAADLVVMNPPFASWNALSLAARDLARSIVRDTSRPDLSMAFVSRALGSLREGGAMAVIVPARIIEADSTRKWRGSVAEAVRIPFISLFDDLTVFSDATVRIGAFICVRGGPSSETLVLQVGAGSTGEALRALRRASSSGPLSEIHGKGWSLRRRVRRGSATVDQDFSPPGHPAHDSIPNAGGTSTAALRTVGALFHVYLGIRTGLNKALVLSEEQLMGLPEAERIFFRRAVTSKGISEGRIHRHVHVFSPLDIESAPTDEVDLRARLPTYYGRYIEPKRSDLIARRSLRGDAWWMPSENRTLLATRKPYIVSKNFAGPGGFAIDEEGCGAVLVGFAWLPLNHLATRMSRRDGPPPPIVRAYLALLNSRAFFDRVAASSPSVMGGQWNLSKRHVDPLPMPNLSEAELAGYVTPLAAFADVAYRSAPAEGGRRVSDEDRERLCGELLENGTYSCRVDLEDPPFIMPEWIRGALEAGLSNASRPVRYRLLRDLQDGAMAGRFAIMDEIVMRLDVAMLHDLTLVTLVRGTFPFRLMLRHWVPFRNRVAAEFVARGHAVDYALDGLFA